MPVPVRISFGSALIACAVALLPACNEATELTELTPIEAQWPPEEGLYCGSAPDVCGDDGTPWICGMRPLWQPLDCAAECALSDQEPRGCILVDDNAQRALAALELPSNDVSVDSLPGARCLCTPPEQIQCAGPAHRACADRDSIWMCDDSLSWRKESCADQCQALRPSLVADRCEHDVAFRFQRPGTDGCRCTAIGSPCAIEGAITCDQKLVLGCTAGTYEVFFDCEDEIDCASPAFARCDMAARADPPCVCL